MLAILFGILVTAGTAIVFVSFQLKNESTTFASVDTPVEQPPLQSEEPPLQQANQTSQSSRSSTPDSSPDAIANSSNSSTESTASSTSSNETIEPEEIDFMLDAKPADIDGIVSQDEYVMSTLFEEINLELFWTIPHVTEQDGKRVIYFALRSPVEGCVGISLDRTGRRLQGGDVLLGYVDNDPETDRLQTHMSDNYANEETSHAPDQEIEGTTGAEESSTYGKFDILQHQGSFSRGGTTLEFSRYLDTGDNAYDKVIKEESNWTRVQVAYSDSPEYNCFQSDNRANKRINFFTGDVQDELQA